MLLAPAKASSFDADLAWNRKSWQEEMKVYSLFGLPNTTKGGDKPSADVMT